MGYIKHHAIVLTTWDDVGAVIRKARSLGLEVIGPGCSKVNGYQTITICPDGSKEGWTESDQGDWARADLKEWLKGQVNYEWVEVAYGSDDGYASVRADAWNNT
jgi:hypothetical protein